VQYASKLLTEEEICRVNVAIEQAQGRTSARIVPVIATSSVRYDRVEDMVGLWAAALGLALLCMFLSGAPLSKDWSLPGRVWGTGLLLVLGIISAGFIGGALLGTRIGWLRRLFLTQRKMNSAVQERAREVFSRHLVRYGSEDDSKLVLIYVSLCEHDVVVLSSDTLQGQT
jgi:putative membrane protein